MLSSKLQPPDGKINADPITFTHLTTSFLRVQVPSVMHEQMLLVGQRYHQLCKRYPPIGRTAAVLGKKRRAVGFIICLLLVLNLASRFGTHYFYSHADQEAWRFRWAAPASHWQVTEWCN